MSLRTVAGRDPQVVPLDEGLAADRLLSGHVVLDDHAQHLELAVVERHAITVLVRRLALARSECQSTSERVVPQRPNAREHMTAAIDPELH